MGWFLEPAASPEPKLYNMCNENVFSTQLEDASHGEIFLRAANHKNTESG